MIQQSSLQHNQQSKVKLSKTRTEKSTSISVKMEEPDLSGAEKASDDSCRHAAIKTGGRGRGTSSFRNGVVRGRSDAPGVAGERRARAGFGRNERVETPKELKHRRRKLEVAVAV